MAFITKKKIGNKEYFYLRTSKRINGKVKAVNIAYLGASKEEAEKKAAQILKDKERNILKDTKNKKEIMEKKQQEKEKISHEEKEETKNKEEKEFLSFIQEAGLIWGPEPEIYGGFAGFYTYGPLGKLLKNKVENSVRKVFNEHGFREIEGPTIMPDIVWKASGHLDTFLDRIIKCKKCNSIFRADKLIEENFNLSTSNFSNEKILEFIKEKNMKCPSCQGDFENKIQTQSLMIKTKIANEDASLRPETATVTYLPFLRYYNYFRKKIPFAIFQIGKAYRNEISPRQSVLRSREFTQAEAQIFIDPLMKNNWEKYEEIKNEILPLWDYKSQEKNEKPEQLSIEQAIKKDHIKTKAYAWCLWLAYKQFINFGIPKEKIRIRQHFPNERAFYAQDAWDIEINFNNYSWIEVCGIHDRADYDLKQHSKFSKINLEAQRENGENFIPHVLEIAFGTDRPTYALIDIFYEKKVEKEGKTTFKIPYHMSPIDVSIFPLMKKPELTKIAKEVKEILEEDFIVDYDEAGSIGRRYLRSSTSGTPFAITIDYESLEDETITIRNRDSEAQIRVKIKDLKSILHDLINKKIKFEDAGELFYGGNRKK